MAATQRPPDGSTPPANSKTKKISIDEMFDLMSSGFLRGGIGFLKGGSGELLKTTMPQEVRVGVTQVIQNARLLDLLSFTKCQGEIAAFPWPEITAIVHSAPELICI